MLTDINSVTRIAEKLNLSQDLVLTESLKMFVELKLRDVKSEIFEITKKYRLSDIREFERLYKEGKIEEADTWKDYQRLDHLEYKRDELEKILMNMT